MPGAAAWCLKMKNPPGRCRDVAVERPGCRRSARTCRSVTVDRRRAERADGSAAGVEAGRAAERAAAASCSMTMPVAVGLDRVAAVARGDRDSRRRRRGSRPGRRRCSSGCRRRRRSRRCRRRSVDRDAARRARGARDPGAAAEAADELGPGEGDDRVVGRPRARCRPPRRSPARVVRSPPVASRSFAWTHEFEIVTPVWRRERALEVAHVDVLEEDVGAVADMRRRRSGRCSGRGRSCPSSSSIADAGAAGGRRARDDRGPRSTHVWPDGMFVTPNVPQIARRERVGGTVIGYVVAFQPTIVTPLFTMTFSP